MAYLMLYILRLSPGVLAAQRHRGIAWGSEQVHPARIQVGSGGGVCLRSSASPPPVSYH